MAFQLIHSNAVKLHIYYFWLTPNLIFISAILTSIPNKIIFADDLTKETVNTSTIIHNIGINADSDLYAENTSL